MKSTGIVSLCVLLLAVVAVASENMGDWNTKRRISGRYYCSISDTVAAAATADTVMYYFDRNSTLITTADPGSARTNVSHLSIEFRNTPTTGDSITFFGDELGDGLTFDGISIGVLGIEFAGTHGKIDSFRVITNAAGVAHWLIGMGAR
jgi:hypothetical protein